MTVDMKRVVPISKLQGDSFEDTKLLQDLQVESERYLAGHSWCKSIKERYFGIGIGGIFGVFLYKIVSSKKNVDPWLWIIDGDLPPLYITTDIAPNPACALDAYIGAMQKWVDAALLGKAAEKLPPVTAELNHKNGQSLQKRLEYLRREVLVHYKEDLTH